MWDEVGEGERKGIKLSTKLNWSMLRLRGGKVLVTLSHSHHIVCQYTAKVVRVLPACTASFGGAAK